MDSDAKLRAWQQVLARRRESEKLLRQKVVEQKKEEKPYTAPELPSESAKLTLQSESNLDSNNHQYNYLVLNKNVSKLQRQMTEIRKYVQIWIKREQRNRKAAAIRIQRYYRRYQRNSGRTRPKKKTQNLHVLIEKLMIKSEIQENTINNLSQKLVECINRQQALENQIESLLQ